MAKKQVKNKKPSQVWKKYIVSNDKIERKMSCPKCGSSFFLAMHKDRRTCGKCAYTEFTRS